MTRLQIDTTSSPLKKRRQVGRACSNCRRSKTACADVRPCPRCVSHGLAECCVDAPKKRKPTKGKKSPEVKDEAGDSSMEDTSPNNIQINQEKNIMNVQQPQTLQEVPAISEINNIMNINEDNHLPVIHFNNATKFEGFKNTGFGNSFTFPEDKPASIEPTINPTLQPMQIPVFSFPTVSEPSVDLFGDNPTPSAENPFRSCSEDTLSGLRKPPSLEALLSNIIREIS